MLGWHCFVIVRGSTTPRPCIRILWALWVQDIEIPVPTQLRERRLHAGSIFVDGLRYSTFWSNLSMHYVSLRILGSNSVGKRKFV